MIAVDIASTQTGSLAVCAQVNTGGGITNTQATALANRRSALQQYVNVLGGSLVVLTQAGLNAPYAFFPSPLTFVQSVSQTVVNIYTVNFCLLSPGLELFAYF